MLNEFIPNISRHYLYSLLELDQVSGMKIIDTVSKLKSDEIEEFLYSLGNSLARYFFDLDESLRLQQNENSRNKISEEFTYRKRCGGIQLIIISYENSVIILKGSFLL